MFMLLAFRALIDERAVLGGILLGLAVASRPSTIAFGASALAWLVLMHPSASGPGAGGGLVPSPPPAWGTVLRRAVAFGVATALTTVVAFLPLFLKYGPSLLDVVATRPALVRVAYAATLGTFGLIGTIAI